MSIETAVLALVVFGGAAAVMILSLVLAKFAVEARRMVHDDGSITREARCDEDRQERTQHSAARLRHGCQLGLDYARHRAGLPLATTGLGQAKEVVMRLL